MFVTYEGGPLFGLNPRGAVDETGARLELISKTAEPVDAAGFSRRGALFATHGKLREAIADFDRAIAMAPGQADYVYQRACARIDNDEPLLAAADLDMAITLAPNDARARMARATMRLVADDETSALIDLKAADAALAPTADARLALADQFARAGDFEAALANYQRWLAAHAEDVGRPSAFAGACWARAVLDRELDRALSDCNAALRLRRNTADYLDSRALVRLRRGELDKALADYDAVLALAPHSAWSLYARSVAARRAGKAAQADADKAAAIAIDPHVAERAKRYRIEP